jgi:hypothetical protein
MTKRAIDQMEWKYIKSMLNDGIDKKRAEYFSGRSETVIRDIAESTSYENYREVKNARFSKSKQVAPLAYSRDHISVLVNVAIDALTELSNILGVK